RTFKYIFQIISKVFFLFFLFLVVSLCEREIKEEEALSTVSVSKSISRLTISWKAGAKVRTLSDNFQMFRKFFFKFLFSSVILG
ncbi:hypothetical protein DW036_25070, partial [Bacteroides sp. AF39-11AC]